jgi:hypothetical protein
MDYCRFFPRAKLISLETYGFDWQLGWETNAIRKLQANTSCRKPLSCVDNH